VGGDPGDHRSWLLVGPTASGKSGIALEVADRLGGGSSGGSDRGGSGGVELVSVDSMAVYRGMDIGTAKPTPRGAGPGCRTTWWTLVDPSEEVHRPAVSKGAARPVLAGIARRGRAALLVGGTGLYLRSVVDDLSFPGRFPEVAAVLSDRIDRSGPQRGVPGRSPRCVSSTTVWGVLDPVAADRIDPANRRRLVRALEVTLGSGRPFLRVRTGTGAVSPEPAVTIVGIDPAPDALDRRIGERFAGLMELGLLEEVRGLCGHPGGISRARPGQALGYRELLAHLEEGVPLSEAVRLTVQRTRAFARRQRAWFRRDPRIVWLDPTGDPVGAITALVGNDPAAAQGVGEWTSTR